MAHKPTDEPNPTAKLRHNPWISEPKPRGAALEDLRAAGGIRLEEDEVEWGGVSLTGDPASRPTPMEADLRAAAAALLEERGPGPHGLQETLRAHFDIAIQAEACGWVLYRRLGVGQGLDMMTLRALLMVETKRRAREAALGVLVARRESLIEGHRREAREEAAEELRARLEDLVSRTVTPQELLRAGLEER